MKTNGMRSGFVGALLMVAVVVSATGQGTEIPYEAEWIVYHTGWTAKYVQEYELPAWVAYHLTAFEVDQELARTDDYREDPWIPTESADPDEYAGTGYHRGHLAPAEDFQWSDQAMSETFLMSNMAPQVGGFNTGLWKRLENRVRAWALDFEELYVVSGPVLTDEIEEWIGENDVAVPLRFYKVVLDLTEPELKAIGFIMPNQSDPLGTWEFARTVDEVEELTGIDFFHAVDDELEEQLEGSIDLDLWTWEER